MKLSDRIFGSFVIRALQSQPEVLPHHVADKKSKAGLKMRVRYQLRLCLRFLLFCLTIYSLYFSKNEISIIFGMNFFKKFTLLHLAWVYWIIEILLPTFATRGMISIGSIKHWQRTYIPSKKFNPRLLFCYMKGSTKDSLKVFAVWLVYMTLLLIGHVIGFLGKKEMLLICAGLNVLDIIFVLYWCPLRACFMKNRCCTTCRIFNWDHILIFSALMFVPGFFGYTIVILSVAGFLIWEVCFFLHPERFWEGTNCSLRCSECTDKICEHAFTGKKHKQKV